MFMRRPAGRNLNKLKMRTHTLKIFFLCALALAGCRRYNEGGSDNSLISREIIIPGLAEDKWTYFSFDKGDVVGQSSFADAEEDKLWAERTDWDLAFCGNYVKTNSGSSGKGLGGIQKDNESTFDLIDIAPSDAYIVDSVEELK